MIREKIENILCEVFMPEEITGLVPAILQAIRDELPEKQKVFDPTVIGWVDGYNKALDQIKEALSK